MSIEDKVLETQAELIPLGVAAKLIGHSERTVYRMISTGQFPAAEYRRGGNVGRRTRLWRRSTVSRWIESSLTPAHS